MKIFLDDIRFPSQSYSQEKDEDWMTIRTHYQFKDLIENNFYDIEVLSFDHDLSLRHGDDEITGYTLLKWMCQYILDNNLSINHLDIYYHSANPVGVKNMSAYWDNFKNNYIPEKEK